MGKGETQDIEPGDVASLPATVPTTDAELATFVEYANALPTDDPEVVNERILRALLTATTADDILRSGESIPASEVFDTPLTIIDIRGSESSFEEGPNLYLHVDAKIKANGDTVTFSCGARDVVMKLIRLHQLRMLPIDAVIVQSTKRTKAGFYPVFLRALNDDGEPF